MTERICTIKGCTGKQVGRNWCRKHYTRWTRHGDPLHGEDVLPPMTSGVYSITCLANGRVYIGSSGRVRSRWKTHKSHLRLGRHTVPRLQADWNQFGSDAFVFELVSTVADNDERFTQEQVHLTAALATGRCYNLSPNSRNNGGHRFTAAQSERVSTALKGKPKTAEHRANLWRDREATPEFREQMARNGAMGKGKPKSVEHRRKIGAAQRGASNHKAKVTEDQVREIRRRSALGESYASLGREFGISAPAVRDIATGRRWQHVT